MVYVVKAEYFPNDTSRVIIVNRYDVSLPAAATSKTRKRGAKKTTGGYTAWSVRGYGDAIGAISRRVNVSCGC